MTETSQPVIEHEVSSSGDTDRAAKRVGKELRKELYQDGKNPVKATITIETEPIEDE